MSDVIVLVIWLGNFIGWWMAARFLYRWWRPGGDAPLTYNTGTTYHPCEEEWATGWVVVVSMLTALAWPIIFTAMTIVLGQPSTAREREAIAQAAERAAAARIKELDQAERELEAATAKMNEAAGIEPPSPVKAKSKNRREWRDPLSKRVWHD